MIAPPASWAAAPGRRAVTPNGPATATAPAVRSSARRSRRAVRKRDGSRLACRHWSRMVPTLREPHRAILFVCSAGDGYRCSMDDRLAEGAMYSTFHSQDDVVRYPAGRRAGLVGERRGWGDCSRGWLMVGVVRSRSDLGPTLPSVATYTSVHSRMRLSLMRRRTCACRGRPREPPRRLVFRRAADDFTISNVFVLRSDGIGLRRKGYGMLSGREPIAHRTPGGRRATTGG